MVTAAERSPASRVDAAGREGELPLLGRLFMSTLSRYGLGVILGVVIATGLFDGPLSLVSAAQYLKPAPAPAPMTIVDRSSKGDRLQPGMTIMIRRDQAPAAPATTGINEATDPRLVPASVQDCEPVASPYADPLLGKFAGRCFV
jgi:hypothetical protein